MKALIVILFTLILAVPAFAGVDEGIVTWTDGKGAFEVKTERNGTMVLHATPELISGEFKIKTKRWPHRYKDIVAGDYISVDWQYDPKTGKRIAKFVGIRKRGG